MAASVPIKRLMHELKMVQRVMKDLPGLAKCEPMEDNLLQWTVDMRFPVDSPLQRSLNNYAEALLDESQNVLSFQVRFPNEYPFNPPEVWLRKPRLKYNSGAAVTFGGKVCISLLTSAVWVPNTNMTAVFEEVQKALLEAGAEVDSSVAIRPYLKPAPMLERVRSDHFPKANDFEVHDIQVLSPIEAGPFFGDLSRLEATDKIALSSEYGLEIYNRPRIDNPIMFEVKSQRGRKFHCAIFDFIQGLPREIVIVPKWVMNDLGLKERERVRVRGVSLELITFVKIQPHSVDFYEAVQRSGVDTNVLLQETLRRFSALTEDTAIPIEIGAGAYDVQIVALEPKGSVRIIDTDTSQDFEFKVDFEPAPNLEDEEDKKARQAELLERFKAKEQKKHDEAAAGEQKRADALRKRFERKRAEAKASAGADDGKEGDVQLRLRLPGGDTLEGTFREGAPSAALVALVLGSEWADGCSPWGVQLSCSYPRRTLTDKDTVTKDMHRSTIGVQEQRPPEDDEEVFAEAEDPEPEPAAPPLGPSSAAPGQSSGGYGGILGRFVGGMLSRHSIWGDDIDDSNSTPSMEDAALQQQTLKMFEVQRFIQAGMDPAEAARRVDAGERAPEEPPAGPVVDRPPPVRSRVPPPPPTPQPARPQTDLERQMAEVKGVTGADDGQVLQLLEQCNWDTQRAINAYFDAM